MNQKKCTILAVILLATGGVLAAEFDYSPFPDGARVKKVAVKELEPQTHALNEKETKGLDVYVFPGKKPVQLKVFFAADAFSAEITVGGKVTLPKTEFSQFGTIGWPSVYSADLNQDGVDDYVLTSNSGGCGLACMYNSMSFILSSPNGHKLTTTVTMANDCCADLVVLNGVPCFIHTSMGGVEKCNDGKSHNFWIHNLLVFGKAGDVKVKNDTQPGFPKVIFYTNKPNHKETTIITKAQKQTLQKDALAAMFEEAGETKDKNNAPTKK